MTKKKILIIIISFAIIAGLFCFAQKLQKTYLNINNKQVYQNVKQNNTNKISNAKANEVSQNRSNESKNTVNEKADNDTTVSKNTEQQNTTVTDAKSTINSDINKSSSKNTSDNTNKTNTAVSKPNTQTVTKNTSAQTVNETPNVTIMNAITGKVILNKYVSYDNITVADVTMKMLDDANISYKTSGFGSTIYFSSIDGLNEKDNGPMSGWAYYVKKSRTSAFIKPNVGAGSYILNKGDVLVWKYLANALNN